MSVEDNKESPKGRKKMFALVTKDRKDEREIGVYATFDCYAEAVKFGNRYESDFRAAGQFWVVREVDESDEDETVEIADDAYYVRNAIHPVYGVCYDVIRRSDGGIVTTSYAGRDHAEALASMLSERMANWRNVELR